MLKLRQPDAKDGPTIEALITACPPLDQNSLYSTLLLCTDFADTCVVAEQDGKILGWVSGYIPPNDPATLFVWQVAVHEDARGQSLGRRMIAELLARPAAANAHRLRTTITPDNDASWALFQSVARHLGAALNDQPWFLREAHFAGAHDTENMVTIGPLKRAARAA
ncbi:MAG: diaminobutyrate acetyltransferase [Alphaproteobacteria bacterium]